MVPTCNKQMNFTTLWTDTQLIFVLGYCIAAATDSARVYWCANCSIETQATYPRLNEPKIFCSDILTLTKLHCIWVNRMLCGCTLASKALLSGCQKSVVLWQVTVPHIATQYSILLYQNLCVVATRELWQKQVTVESRYVISSVWPPDASFPSHLQILHFKWMAQRLVYPRYFLAFRDVEYDRPSLNPL